MSPTGKIRLTHALAASIAKQFKVKTKVLKLASSPDVRWIEVTGYSPVDDIDELTQKLTHFVRMDAIVDLKKITLMPRASMTELEITWRLK